MNEAHLDDENKLQTGIQLLSSYALGENLVISDKFIQECINAIQIKDPLLRICYAARCIGIDAAVQEVYTSRAYIDRDQVWLVEKDDRMILIDTPVWKIAFRVIDPQTGTISVNKGGLAQYLNFSWNEVPYRALVLQRDSLRRWADKNPITNFSEIRRWWLKHSGWMALIGVMMIIIYIMIFL